MHLNNSELWNQTKLHLQGTEETLIQTHFEQGDYIGYFLESDLVTVQELRGLESIMRSRLQNYCPKLDTTKLKISLLPQIFIS
jgi:hypothetical protein